MLYVDLIEHAVGVLAAFRRINLSYKVEGYRNEAKEFINAALSQTLDLKEPVQHWSRLMLSRVRNGDNAISLVGCAQESATMQKVFCVISHSWLFTTEAKQRILKEYFRADKFLNAQILQLSDLWNA